MSLKIEQLRGTLHDAEAETRLRRSLIKEVARILGPKFDASQQFMSAVKDANTRLAALESSGRRFNGTIDVNLLESFKDHPSHSVRSLVARFAPNGTRLQEKFLYDSSPSVRSTASRHVSIRQLKEAAVKFSHDDNMQSIYRERNLNESGVWRNQGYSFSMPSPEENKKLKNLRHGPAAELSNAFYTTMAKKILSDYGTAIESNWEEAVTHRICASMRATSLVEIDHKKLHKEIMKQLDDRSKRAEELERVTLRESADHNEQWGTAEEDYSDPRESLVASRGSDREFVRMFNEAYRVIESIIPPTIRKYRVSEGLVDNIMVPMKATTPGGNSVDAIDERLLDRYVEAWNRTQAADGEPVRIGWHHDVTNGARVSFEATLK